MVNKKTHTSDFENRYFDLIQDNQERLEGKVDENTKILQSVEAHVARTNGRVDKLEKEVFGRIKPSDLPAWYRDPKILGILFNITLIVLIFLSFVAKINVGDLLP